MQTITKRLVAWAGGVALLLMIPLLAMQFTNKVNWTLSDFVFASIVLFGAAATFETIARMGTNTVYRVAVGMAVLASLMLVWVNAAVGLIGDGDLDSPNGLYLIVLAVGFLGAIISRFHPIGLSNTLFTMAFLQLLVPVIALTMGWKDFAPGVWQVFMLNSFWVLMYVASGFLFRQSAYLTQNGLKAA